MVLFRRMEETDSLLMSEISNAQEKSKSHKLIQDYKNQYTKTDRNHSFRLSNTFFPFLK